MKMIKAKVVLNEQHQLMEDQKRVLDERFTADGWELYPVPANGWTLEQMEEKVKSEGLYTVEVVFASPIPAMMKILNSWASNKWHVLHNDRREKKELPGGKIIMTVAKEGWQIV
jgi:hypothetical protein